MSSPVLEQPRLDRWRAGAAVRQGPVCVAHVVRSLTTGGQEVLIARLVERMDRTQFRPVVISLLESGWLATRLRDAGITVHSLDRPERFSPDLVLELIRLLRRERVEILHCHNRTPLFYAGLASLATPRLHVMLTRHGNETWTDSCTAPIMRWLVRRAKMVVPVSREIRETVREADGVTHVPTPVIPNGVDTAEFRPLCGSTTRERLGFSPDHFVIGTVARLAPVKNQAMLLRAFALLRESTPHARLLVVGDGALRTSLQELARELGIEPGTLFAGEQQDTLPYYQAMDVFTLPSLTEGTSLTLLEAMACARPVVASAVGGTPDVVKAGVSGLLVSPSDPGELAAALLQMRQMPPGERAAMGTAGREIVLARYSMANMVEQYQSIYRRLAA